MKATILFDEHGKILGISKSVSPQHAGSKFTSHGVVPGAGQRVVEVSLSPEDQNRPLRELHGQYRVDVAALKLVKHDC
jgi:hypothetical protein